MLWLLFTTHSRRDECHLDRRCGNGEEQHREINSNTQEDAPLQAPEQACQECHNQWQQVYLFTSPEGHQNLVINEVDDSTHDHRSQGRFGDKPEGKYFCYKRWSRYWTMYKRTAKIQFEWVINGILSYSILSLLWRLDCTVLQIPVSNYTVQYM